MKDDNAYRYDISLVRNILTSVYASLQTDQYSLIQNHVTKTITGGSEIDVIAQVQQLVEERSTGRHLPEYPPKDIHDRIVNNAMVKLLAAMFPHIDPLNLEAAVKTYSMADGISNYHGGLGEYIIKNISSPTKKLNSVTFQELTEVLSLLPPRAPKELEVQMYRNDEDRLMIQFVGEIDVASTAGKRQE